MNTKESGDIGEDIAVRYLQKKGYRILERNYVRRAAGSPQTGEIDIIAKKGDTISFIEVKTVFHQGKTTEAHWFPEEKVNFQKQRKIARAAESWLMKNKIDLDTKMQIDVISIVVDAEKKKAKVRYLENVAAAC